MRVKLLGSAIACLLICTVFAEGHDHCGGGYYSYGWGGGYGHGWGCGHSSVSLNIGYVASPFAWGPPYWGPSYYYYTPPMVVTSPVVVAAPVTTIYGTSSSDSNTFYKPIFTNSSSASQNSVLTKAQARLISLGYYKGSVDGNFGPATMRAVQTFQSENGLPITGRLDLQTLHKLGINV